MRHRLPVPSCQSNPSYIHHRSTIDRNLNPKSLNFQLIRNYAANYTANIVHSHTHLFLLLYSLSCPEASICHEHWGPKLPSISFPLPFPFSPPLPSPLPFPSTTPSLEVGPFDRRGHGVGRAPAEIEFGAF